MDGLSNMGYSLITKEIEFLQSFLFPFQVYCQDLDRSEEFGLVVD